jgi:hypothetical protein
MSAGIGLRAGSRFGPATADRRCSFALVWRIGTQGASCRRQRPRCTRRPGSHYACELNSLHRRGRRGVLRARPGRGESTPQMRALAETCLRPKDRQAQSAQREPTPEQHPSPRRQDRRECECRGRTRVIRVESWQGMPCGLRTLDASSSVLRSSLAFSASLREDEVRPSRAPSPFLRAPRGGALDIR